MDIKDNKVIEIISNLMDENSIENTELHKSFNIILNMVEKNLVDTLDKGKYIDNAGIIRKIKEILKEKEVFKIIPNLAERTIVAIWGYSKCIGKEFEKIESEIKNNTNLPLLAIPMKEDLDNEIYAITYMDKMVPIKYDEYKYITREIYKKNIDIRKLIKGFVLYYNGKYDKQAYLILPEYIDIENSFYNILKNNINMQILVTDEEEKWKKQIYKLIKKKLHLFGVDENIEEIKKTRNDISIILEKKENFDNLLKEKNIPSINFAIVTEMLEVFMDIDIFYKRTNYKLTDKIERLAKASIKLKVENIKNQVQKYRKNLINEKEKLEKNYKKFTEVREKIINAAKKYEKQISTLLSDDLFRDIDSARYTESLVRLFNKHIYAEEYDSANEDIILLKKSNYKYVNACECLLKVKTNRCLTQNEIHLLKNYPNSVEEISKIKMEMSKELDISTEEKKKLIKNINCIETGKEYYYFGKSLLDKKDYIGAKDALMKSLEEDYEKSGKELIKLADNHPECGVSIEELAENFVPEANFYIGENLLDVDDYRDIDKRDYKKGIINLKMAATKYNIDAIEFLADILFEKYKFIPWDKMEEEENKNAVYNVISLYSFLESKKSNEFYRLRIGLMNCKLKLYIEAYSILKDLDYSEAQYECAKMCQYGNGVAKNLKIAKEHYERVDFDYRDTEEQYYKVCNIIRRDNINNTNYYYSDRDYSSKTYSSHTSSSYDSLCFITTATCVSLGKDEDCKELNELRSFRDKYIAGDNEDGDELIKEYYRIGPIIVKHIDVEWNPYAIYKELWDEYIFPTYKMIRDGDYKSAKMVYVNMVKKLCEIYGVDVKQSIKDRYNINV